MAGKEIVEMKKGKVVVETDEEMILQLSRTYEFEGKEISQVDFSGMEELTADNMIKANTIMTKSGHAAIMTENDMYYTLLLAADATGIPIEFFRMLKPRDAIKVKNKVTSFFFGEE